MHDTGKEYLKKEYLFDCIRQMLVHFDSFKILSRKIRIIYFSYSYFRKRMVHGSLT